jgi:hypothetical protein
VNKNRLHRIRNRADKVILWDKETACREGEFQTKRRGRIPVQKARRNVILRKWEMLKRESQFSRGKVPKRADTCGAKGTIERSPVI